jgi:hypothetical protein
MKVIKNNIMERRQCEEAKELWAYLGHVRFVTNSWGLRGIEEDFYLLGI